MKRVALEMGRGEVPVAGDTHARMARRVVQVLQYMQASTFLPDSETFHWALLACCRASTGHAGAGRSSRGAARSLQDQQRRQPDSSDKAREEEDGAAGKRSPRKRSPGRRSKGGGDEGVMELRAVLRQMWQQSGGQGRADATKKRSEDLILQPTVAHDVVVALGQAGRCWEALAVIEWMRQRGERVVRRDSRTAQPGDVMAVCHEQQQAHVQGQGQEQGWEQGRDQGQGQEQVQPPVWQQTEREVERQLAVLVSAAARRGQWRWARRVVLRMEAAGMAVSQAVWRVVVGAAGRARNAAAAVAVFEAMVEAGHVADVASYGVLLSALEKSGEFQLAEQVWSHMAGTGLRANKEALTTMIMVCGHLGTYSEAVKLFNLLSWPQAANAGRDADVNGHMHVNGTSHVRSATHLVLNGTVIPPSLPTTPCHCNGHPNAHASSHVSTRTSVGSAAHNARSSSREDSAVSFSHRLSAWSAASGEPSIGQAGTLLASEAEEVAASNRVLPRSKVELSRHVLEVLEKGVRGRQHEREGILGSMAGGHSSAMSGSGYSSAIALSGGGPTAGRKIAGSTGMEVDVAAVNALLTVCAKTGEGEGALAWLDMVRLGMHARFNTCSSLSTHLQCCRLPLKSSIQMLFV